MELKKSPKADLQNKKSVFFLTGAIIALCLVISLFSWSKTEKKIDAVVVEVEAIQQEVAEITVQEDKPIEVPKQIFRAAEMINIVNNDVKITEEITFMDAATVDAGNFVPKSFGSSKKVEEEVEEEIKLIADEPALFQGGDINTFNKWVMKDMTYPRNAEENGISGTATVQFVVERDGTVSNVKILRSSGDKDLDNAAMEKVKKSPKWTAAKTRGRAVRLLMNLPVLFKLN